VKIKCQTSISKWDLQLITHLSSINIKSVLFLLTGNDQSSHVNLHHLIMTLLLSTPHLPNPASKIDCIVRTLCFSDDGKLARCDFDYLFQLAYFQLKLVTNMTYTITGL
jgi:hypothetical protein